MDKVIAVAIATLASLVLSGVTSIANAVVNLTGAQVNDGLINVVVGVSLTAAVGGVAFIINFLLESRGWQKGIDERMKQIEKDLEDLNDDRR